MSSFTKSTLENVEFKTPKLKEAPLVVDDWTLAFRLGFTGKAFWYIIGNRDRLYKVFKIKKATGGLRVIHAPSKMMKVFLTQIRARILLPLTEKLGAHVSAYQVGKSTRDAANLHLHDCKVCAAAEAEHTCSEVVSLASGSNKRWFKFERQGKDTCAACQPVPKHECTRRGVKIHMDLKDFFGSTRRAWIRKYFTEVVGYNHYASNLLATAMTVVFEHRNGKTHQGVPQGAPTSGDICNLVADVRLDQPILAALKGTGWRYSRYADDLYLSHPKNLAQDAVDQMINQIDQLITAAGYKMNRKKLHVQRPHRRQQLLGVVLNQKANIPSDSYRRLYAILTNCGRNGFDAESKRAKFEKPSKFVAWIGGRISYMHMVNPHRAARLKQMFALAKVKHKLDLPPALESNYPPIIDDGSAPVFME